MKKIVYFLLFVPCVIGIIALNLHTVHAAPAITVKLTTKDAEIFDETLKEKLITLSKGSPVIVLSENKEWTKIQYKTVIGYIDKEYVKSGSPQYMRVQAKNKPLVRTTNKQQSKVKGKLELNTVVEVYGPLNTDFVFVKSKGLAGYVNKHGLVKIKKEEPAKKPKTMHKKKIALTFDDGPHPKVTMQVLKTLEKYKAKATFFVIGQEVEKHPETLKAVYKAGHEIGNHTFNHEKLTTLPVEEIQQQILSTDQIIKSTIGRQATVFRPPYGSYDDIILNELAVPSVMWTIDTLDWKHRDPEKTALTVKKEAKNGSIVLMHDIHQSTADALDAILAELQKQGYEFVKVSELLK